MSAFPHLPLFTDAFIADTGHLNAQETGAYLMLMMVAWRSPGCRLADNDDKMARWARVDRRTWLRIKPTVMEFWTLSDGFWTQARLSKERDYVSKRAEVNRANGKHGGRPKSLENNDAANPAGSSRVSEKNPPIPTPIPRQDKNPLDPNGSMAPKGARVRGTRIPENFVSSEEARAVCEEMGLAGAEAVEALAEFRDFWVGVPGVKGTKLDWPATLRNRLREVGRRRPAAPTVAFPRPERSSALTGFEARMEARRARHQQDHEQSDFGAVIDHEGDGRPNGQIRQSAGGEARRFPQEVALRVAGSGWR